MQIGMRVQIRMRDAVAHLERQRHHTRAMQVKKVRQSATELAHVNEHTWRLGTM